jgi:hypothetical protein
MKRVVMQTRYQKKAILLTRWKDPGGDEVREDGRTRPSRGRRPNHVAAGVELELHAEAHRMILDTRAVRVG